MDDRHPSDIWLDEVRVKLYEETKEMTLEEEVAYLRALSAPILEEFNIKPVSWPPVRLKKVVSE
ncbi:hypothetical protein AGMMS50276_26380 [Synergistales bacterium]|nr:hypothetical protein AGMMS50276_26380 [Synergistales bacterium]